LDPGQCWFEFSSLTQDSGVVTVTAKVGDSIRKIRQTIAKTPSGGFNYVMSAGGNINFQGGTGSITGNVNAEGNITKDTNWTTTGVYTENNAVTLPPVVMSNYTKLTTTKYTGNLTVSGVYTQSVHATGKITISDGATITGVLVADADIDIGQNITLNGTLASAANINTNNTDGLNFVGGTGPAGEVLPVLVAGGSIDFRPNNGGVIVVSGYILAGSGITFNTHNTSAVTIHGIMISHGNTTISNQGTVTITYDAALASKLKSGLGSIQFSNWQEL